MPTVTSLLGSRCFGRKALALSRATSLKSFSILVSFFLRSGDSSSSASSCSTSLSRSSSSFRCWTRAVPSLPASSMRLSVSARCASSACFAEVAEAPGPRANECESKAAYR